MKPYFLLFSAVFAAGFSGAALANPTYTEFDAPGEQSTYAGAKSPDGNMLCFTVDQNGVFAGWLRTPMGNFVNFGAAQPTDINSSDAITGYVQDPNNGPLHGILADVTGSYTTFDVPGAAGLGTEGVYINDRGEVAGIYFDAANAAHMFLRTQHGKITKFDAPGAGTTGGTGTFPGGLTKDGIASGYFVDAHNVYHGYIRAQDGTITTLDIQGAGTGALQGTRAYGFSSKGILSGDFVDQTGVRHGFTRTPDGQITVIDYPGALGTYGGSFNSWGKMVGRYVDWSYVSHGYIRSKSGTMSTFNEPHASPINHRGAFPAGIDDDGVIWGDYSDSKGIEHGFIRTP